MQYLPEVKGIYVTRGPK